MQPDKLKNQNNNGDIQENQNKSERSDETRKSQDRGTNDDIGPSAGKHKPTIRDKRINRDKGQEECLNKGKQRRTVSVIQMDPRNFRDAPYTKEDGNTMAAQVIVPPDGGWGWIVLVCSFFCLALTDGAIFSYAPLLPKICEELQIPESLAAVVNAILIAVCLISSPISSALINRYGFRTIAMTGSIISSMAVLAAYLSTGFLMLLLFYGIVNGIGCSMIVLSSSLVVGFYFEKLRYIVMPIVSTGAPIGTMILYPINCRLVSGGGWRNTILFHSGIIGLIYFISLTYRPLTTLTVTEKPEEVSQVQKGVSITSIKSKQKSVIPNVPRLRKTASNVNFPTAAEFFEESTAGNFSSPSTTKRTESRVKFRTLSAVDKDQFKKIMSLASTLSVKNKTGSSSASIEDGRVTFHPYTSTIHIQIEVTQKPDKNTCFGNCCDWTNNPGEARPMYRDDAFYEGNVQSLPAYQRSLMTAEDQNRSGLEYQLEVSRALTMSDLKEKNGIFTTAMRRILATIFDPRLLKQRSFLLFCFAGLFANAGLLVPYVFIQARSLEKGFNPSHAMMLVSIISFSNLVGRLTAIVLSLKIKALDIFIAGLCIAGVATILSGLSNTPVYQFGYCCIFGFCMAHSSLRSLVLVELYGLENLTSSTGIALMFNGVGNLFSTPLASMLRSEFGYDAAFYFSGSFITFAGFVVLLVKL